MGYREEDRLYIGIMSGTSLDAIDVALCLGLLYKFTLGGLGVFIPLRNGWDFKEGIISLEGFIRSSKQVYSHKEKVGRSI